MRECSYLCFVHICCTLLFTLFCGNNPEELKATKTRIIQRSFPNIEQIPHYYVLNKRFTRTLAPPDRLLWFLFAFYWQNVRLYHLNKNYTIAQCHFISSAPLHPQFAVMLCHGEVPDPLHTYSRAHRKQQSKGIIRCGSPEIPIKKFYK